MSRKHLKTLTVQAGEAEWSVEVFSYRDMFEITGRYSSFMVYLLRTEQGYLVAVTNYNCCGFVPADVSARDIQEYVGMENLIDAVTLSTGVRYLIERMEAGMNVVPKEDKVIIEITQDGWKETLYSGNGRTITKEKFRTSQGDIMGLFWNDEDDELYRALEEMKHGCLKIMNALKNRRVH